MSKCLIATCLLLLATEAQADPMTLPAASQPSSSSDPGVSKKVEMPAQHVVSRRAQAKIVIMHMGGRAGLPEVERRVAADLSSIGLKVLSVPTSATDLTSQLAELRDQAIARRAIASVRVLRGKTHQVVQTWIYDAVTNKKIFRQLQLARERGPDAMASAALQVVELLHASLLEIRMRRDAARRAPDVVHKMVASKLDRPRPLGRWAVTGGLWNGWTLGEAGGMAGLTLGLAYRPVRTISLSAEVSAPLMTTLVGDHRGTARIFLVLLQGIGWIEPFPGSRVSPGFGVGAGSLLVGAAGAAAPPNRDQSEWISVPSISFHARLAMRVSEAVRILTTFGANITFPEVRIFFETDTIAQLGRPLLAGALTIEWNWGRP